MKNKNILEDSRPSRTEKIITTLLVIPLAWQVSNIILSNSPKASAGPNLIAASKINSLPLSKAAPGPKFIIAAKFQDKKTSSAGAKPDCPAMPASKNSNDDLAFGIYNLTNADREADNLPKLCYNNQLAQAAGLKAEDMAQQSYFAHVNPEGKDMRYFIAAGGYEYDKAGENLAVNFIDPKQLEQAWMDSEHHKENILNPSYSDIGIGIAQGQYQGHNTTFFAVMFGEPED